MKDVLKIYAKKGNYGWFAVVDNGKKDDNERVIYFMELAFKQGNEPAVSPCRLDIGHCFLSCYPSKAGIKPKLVITEYEVEKTFDNQPAAPQTVANQPAAPQTVANQPAAPQTVANQPAPSGANVYHAPAVPDPVMPYDPYAQGGMGASYPTVDSPSDEDIPF